MYYPRPSLLESVDINFGVPPNSDVELEPVAALKAAFRELADFIIHHTPDCRDQQLSLRYLARARTEALDSLAPLNVAKHQQLAQAAAGGS
jgi:hypothetical protein